MKKKILVFHPSLAPYRVDFFNACHEFFDAVFYFNLTNVSDQKFDQEALKSSCNFKCNYLTKGFDLFNRSFRVGIIPLIVREKPDIVLCSEYGPITLMVFIYKKLFNRSFKVYSISDDSIDNAISRKGLRSLLRNLICKRADGVIFASSEVSNWHKENISRKINVMELPIIHNEKIFRTELTKSIAIANKNILKYNLLNKKVLLFVGRLVTVKNLHFLMSTFRLVKYENVVLVIVGDGVLFNQLKTLSKTYSKSNEIIFTGRKEGLELLSWYLVGSVFVLPSTHEPFGAVVNEALISGCYTLCSSKAGASSLINSLNGRLFNPFNEENLLECIEDALISNDHISGEISMLRKNKMSFLFDEKISNLLKNL